MKRLPILHIKDSSGIFGSEQVILTLARNIDQSRFEFHLACLRHGDGRSDTFIKIARRTGINVIPIDADHRLEWSAVNALRRIIIKHKIAILHAHDYKCDIYGLLGSLNLPVKRVLTSHGSTRDSLTKKIYLGLDEGWIYPRYDRIIAVSEHLGKELRRRKGISNRVRVIQNGLDVDLLKSQVSSEDAFASWVSSIKKDNTVLVGVVGRLFPDKGHHFFFQAFARVVKKHKTLKALIVGKGPHKEYLAQLIKAHHIDDHVHMCGFVSDMPAVYRNIDCLVIPSLTEGLPYTLLEAMYYGVPVIATAVGDIPCLIKPDVSGVLMRPGKTEDIYNKLDEFMRDRTRAAQMAEQAARLVESEFSASAMARRIETLYLEMTAVR
jgi:glycosyltransferase involved in cell wall biosynthesis